MNLKTDAIDVVWAPDAQPVLFKAVAFDQFTLRLGGEQKACAIDADLAVGEAGTYLPFV